MLAMLLALIALCATHVAVAAGEPVATGEAAKLAQPLTTEAVRELVARMSDAEVRKLLIAQLDRGTAPVKPPVSDAAMGIGMLGAMNDSTGMARSRIAEVGTAALALPTTIGHAFERLREPEVMQRVLTITGILAAMWIAGALAEILWRRAARTWRARRAPVGPQTVVARALELVVVLAIDALALVAFAAAAMAVFLALWQAHELTRVVVLALTGALLVTRAVAIVARFLLAPSRPEARLLPLGDAPARSLARFAVLITGLSAFGVLFVRAIAFRAGNVPAADLLMMVLLVIGLALTLWTIWKVRQPIAELIRGAEGGSPVARIAADLWPIAAALYVLAVFLGRGWELLAATPGTTASGAAILSLLILVGLPVVDYGLCRALVMASEQPSGAASPQMPRRLVAYEPVLRKVIHIVVVVVGLLWLADLWNLNLFAIAQQSLGGRVASSMLGIGIVLLLGFMLWEITRTAIDRRLAAERDQPVDLPSSRLRTLLPLLRVTILITIAVMTVLSVLAALGVDILPLLAGASIVGVAIGFGSQTLVRDIVSGAFFLMDDAFRLGEYIEVGDAKGRIEKITVRSLFLRHHRGALNVLPYGEIKRLRNNSRDWMIMVMEFRLAFDTDIKKVKKILKTIGEEIAADPELGPELLQPLKSQGVMSTDDSAMVLRAKYMARPGNALFMIRRVAYEKILKAFAENGIQFASRRVAVYVPPGASDEERVRVAAAAMANEPPSLPRKTG